MEDRSPERVKPQASPPYTPGAPLIVPGQPFPTSELADGMEWSESTWTDSATARRSPDQDIPGPSDAPDTSDSPDTPDPSGTSGTPEEEA